MDKPELEALKAANPILQVLQSLGVETRNNRFRCLRPEGHTHGDRTPSVTVWPERGQFKCWVCPDVKGDVIDLVRLVKRCSFREALDFLGQGAHVGAAPRSPAPNAGSMLRGRPASPTLSDSQGNIDVTEEAGQTRLFSNSFQSGVPLPEVAASATSMPPRAPAPHVPLEEAAETALRRKILAVLLDLCEPVGGKVARYLQKRRIFKRTWDKQGLRMLEDYHGISRSLVEAFDKGDLERTGFFNSAGNLRYYRHKLLFPYFDRDGKPVYMQARAIDEDVKPKELSLSGHIPLPYNVRLLDGEPGHIYLCEGVIDTLTLIEQGFAAVGVPGAANFKPAWAALFKNKTVHVAFDPDAPGENGAARAIEIFSAQGIDAKRLAPPQGKDLNDWFRRG